MIALCYAILLLPRAKHVVITAGSPSGIAATAKATATLKYDIAPLHQAPNTGSENFGIFINQQMKQITVIYFARSSPNSLSFFFKGVSSSSSAAYLT